MENKVGVFDLDYNELRAQPNNMRRRGRGVMQVLMRRGRRKTDTAGDGDIYETIFNTDLHSCVQGTIGKLGQKGPEEKDLAGRSGKRI